MGTPEQPSWTDKKGWAQGDDAEAEVKRTMGEDGVNQIRAEVAARRAQRLKGLIAESRKIQRESEGKPHRLRMEKAIRTVFRQELEKAGGELDFTYQINRDHIIGMSRDLLETERGKGMSLPNCSDAIYGELEGYGKLGELVAGPLGWTIDDLIAGARKIKTDYPDITFEFPPDPTGKTFTWIAKLEKK